MEVDRPVLMRSSGERVLAPAPVAAGHCALGAVADDAVRRASRDFANLARAEILGEIPGEPRIVAGVRMQGGAFLFRERVVEERRAVDLAVEAVDRRADRTDRAGREKELVETRTRAVESSAGVTNGCQAGKALRLLDVDQNFACVLTIVEAEDDGIPDHRL